MTADITQDTTLPIPPHFDPSKTDSVWGVDYAMIEREGEAWARTHDIAPATSDRVRVALVLIDVQITFCTPGFELFVGGRSGRGAVEDNVRLCEFIYRNMRHITRVFATMDTHTLFQIFHPLFWINSAGRHPAPYTAITHAEVVAGLWKVNPLALNALGTTYGDYTALQKHAEYYTAQLERTGKYALLVWPPHAMLGSIGHALVPSVHEAVEFLNTARASQTGFEIKGGHPLTENYSVFSPEVTTTTGGAPLPGAHKNDAFIETLIGYSSGYDVIGITGQALSHCVAWTIDDLLREIQQRDPAIARKVHIISDCSSPVVTPSYDFTDDAAAALSRFEAAGMRIVKSTDPLTSWPGYAEALNSQS
ncbi:MAG TPA: isochorismatase [Chloroflexia bacterium]|nr:isochorismatase [Chloroflexia bacterium]